MINSSAETIVIGGGIVGSSIAYRLAEKGQQVIVLEKARVGEEASGRNAGFVVLPERVNNPGVMALGLESAKLWASMNEELDCDVGYRRVGCVRVALSEEQLGSLHERMKRQQAIGLDAEMLSPEETRRLSPHIPSDLAIHGAKYSPIDGHANPLLVVKAICRAARRKKVQIREHEPVRRVKTEVGRVTAVVTDKSEYHASTFVIAAGAWSRGLCNTIGLDFPAVVEKGQVLVTEVLPAIFDQLIVIEDLLCRQALEGNVHLSRLSSSVRTDSFDKSTLLSDFREMRKFLAWLSPSLLNVNLIRAFTGLDDNTPDGVPILDRAPGFQNLFVATGASGYGFSLGPATGKLIAEWITEGQSSIDLSGMRWNRFDGMPHPENFNFRATA